MEINLCLYLFYVCFLTLLPFFLISLINIYNTSTLFSGEERNVIKSSGQNRIIQHMKKLLTPGQTGNVACKSHRKKRKKFSLSQLPQFF